MPDILMKCGCRANATHNGEPSCVIHVGLTPDALVQAETPNLEGRFAYCYYCKREEPSSLQLPFFEYKPEHASRGPEWDRYYCGCRGWD